jgi:cytochrome c
MRGFFVGCGMVAIALISLRLGAVGAQEDPAKPEYYTTKVKPIFDANCARCHAGLNRRGGLNMETRAGLLKGGHDGTVLIPGDPDKSLLVRLIRHAGPADDPMDMPPKKPKLSDADIAVVAQWVKAGAIMPEEVAGR